MFSPLASNIGKTVIIHVIRNLTCAIIVAALCFRSDGQSNGYYAVKQITNVPSNARPTNDAGLNACRYNATYYIISYQTNQVRSLVT